MPITPPPTGEKDLSSPVWQNWFNQLQIQVGSTDSGSYESRIAAIEADYYSKTGGAISGNVVVEGTLTCEDDVDFDQDLNVDGGLIVDLTSNLKGAVDCDSTLNVDGNGTFKGINQFGNIGGGNYSEFEADGTLEFNGDATVFRDELIDASRIVTTGSNITLDSAEITIDLGVSCTPVNDWAYYNIQFNHDRKNGVNIYPHVHWFQTGNNVPNFLIQYRWQKNGSPKETSWTNYKMGTNLFTYTSGTLNQITYGAGITPPSGDDVSDILQVKFTRDTNNDTGIFSGTDSYSSVVKVMYVDVHIEMDTVGSRSEYAK
jgi:hypothetical protein